MQPDNDFDFACEWEAAQRRFKSDQLRGKVAIVTGGGRGIGRASALALAAAGAEIIAMSRTESEIDALAAAIAGGGGKARAIPCDVKDSARLAKAFAQAGRADILVNNVGGNIPKPFLDLDEASLDHILDINLKSAFLVAQLGARMMVQGGGGVIVNMSSQFGHVGAAGRAAYCAAKHGVEGLTKAMALELAPHNIRVTSVGPTFVETQNVRRILSDPETRKWAMTNIPQGHPATVWDVAGTVLFLASPAAAAITGSCILVDGGWTAH